MATIELWPQWLTFLNILHRDLLPCKFEWGVQNFSFPSLFDSYRELLLTRNNLSLGTPFGHALPSSAMSLLVIALNFTRVVTVLDVPFLSQVWGCPPSEYLYFSSPFKAVTKNHYQCQVLRGQILTSQRLQSSIGFYICCPGITIQLWCSFLKGLRVVSPRSRRPKTFYQLYRIQPLFTQKLLKNLQLVVWLVPLFLPQYPRFIVSPLGVVPKKSPEEFRLIHHLSFPKDASVNDVFFFSWKQHCLLFYY